MNVLYSAEKSLGPPTKNVKVFNSYNFITKSLKIMHMKLYRFCYLFKTIVIYL